MSDSNVGLDALQRRILEALGDIEPRWTLVGGGALAGFLLHHRTTRDLDLFWRGLDELGRLGRDCEQRLRARGLEVSIAQDRPSFVRLRVGDGASTTLVDLVADPSTAIDAPDRVKVGSATIDVSAVHDLFVDKLCTLLSRSEIRDLIDTRALLDNGADLDRALADAPRRDAGFSLLTLTWVLRGFGVERLGRVAGLAQSDIAALARFRDEFIAQLVSRTRPTG